MKNSVGYNAEQIKNKCGTQYRASGNLLIITARQKTIPAGYSGCRGSVMGFSGGSGIRMRRYLRECTSDYGYMVTLTYPGEYPSTGTETKNHLRRFLQELQREAKRQGKETTQPVSAFWFLEFQGRGAPHYHIFTNHPVNKVWASKRWYDIVGSEDIRHLHAGTRCEKLVRGRAGTISYASKYAAKMEQKLTPKGFENVGRFWGVYGVRTTMAADTFVSNADAGCSNVAQAVKNLIKFVNMRVSAGDAEVIIKKNGVRVLSIHCRVAMRRIRMLVSAICAQTLVRFDYFSDAEVDSGELF